MTHLKRNDKGFDREVVLVTTMKTTTSKQDFYHQW